MAEDEFLKGNKLLKLVCNQSKSVCSRKDDSPCNLTILFRTDNDPVTSLTLTVTQSTNKVQCAGKNVELHNIILAHHCPIICHIISTLKDKESCRPP